MPWAVCVNCMSMQPCDRISELARKAKSLVRFQVGSHVFHTDEGLSAFTTIANLKWSLKLVI